MLPILVAQPSARSQTTDETTVDCSNIPKDENGLWNLVSECCVKHQNPLHLCIQEGNKYYIVKDVAATKPEGFLIVPDEVRLTGIGDTTIFDKPYVDFWEDGVNFITKELKPKKMDELGLAINSQPSLTQKVLHIHASCVHGEVVQALYNTDASIKSERRTLTF